MHWPACADWIPRKNLHGINYPLPYLDINKKSVSLIKSCFQRKLEANLLGIKTWMFKNHRKRVETFWLNDGSFRSWKSHFAAPLHGVFPAHRETKRVSVRPTVWSTAVVHLPDVYRPRSRSSCDISPGGKTVSWELGLGVQIPKFYFILWCKSGGVLS